MVGTQAPAPASISKQEFDDFLAQYEPLLEAVSAAKPSKLKIATHMPYPFPLGRTLSLSAALPSVRMSLHTDLL